MSDEITIEVAYGAARSQTILRLQVKSGTTVGEAINLSGILKQFPEINLGANKVGIFGKLARTDIVLCNRDRVEIYRALIADPKEARRRRAQAAKRGRK
ncbi:MAG TPA: RnfH family protein [Burkholderiales bacterium]|nr:RnfH family protein [Burkholderiales bacterium]